MYLRQSTTQTIRFGPCLDIGDAVSEEIALTLAQADMRLSKDGGAFAQKNAAGNATHDSDGWYSTSFNDTDTATVGELILNVHQPANMLPVWMRWWVIEEAVYDSMFGAGATGPLQPTTAGRTLDIATTGEVALDFGSTIGTLDAAQFGADFITAAKIADNAFLAVNFASGSLDGKGDWNIDKTGYALTTADWNVGKTGYTISAIDANVITAASINAAALNGKGDWNINKTGYALTTADWNVGKTGYTISAIDANVITATSINAAAFTAAKFGGDFITASSIADNAFLAVNFAASSLNGKGDWNVGKSGYALTTADWNVGKTGYTISAIGANVITAASINASALDGKGNWNINKSGYALTTADWNVGKTGYSISGSLTTLDALQNISAATVNAEMLDVLTTDTFAEPGQGAPLPTTSIERKLAYLYKFLINEKESDSTNIRVKNAAATVVDQKCTISDDTSTYTQGEYVSGP